MFYYWYWQWYLILYVLIPGSYQLHLQSFHLPLFYIPGIGWSWQQLRRHTELGNKFWRMWRRSGGTVYKQVKVRGVVISFIKSWPLFPWWSNQILNSWVFLDFSANIIKYLAINVGKNKEVILENLRSYQDEGEK